jgi:hypothetical protein
VYCGLRYADKGSGPGMPNYIQTCYFAMEMKPDGRTDRHVPTVADLKQLLMLH